MTSSAAMDIYHRSLGIFTAIFV